MLDCYSRRLAAVEAHATYRQLPRPSALEHWISQVPDRFSFCPKAHLGITHRRDLDGVEERISTFFSAVTKLGTQLGPVLFQLPHRHPDLDRLDRLLDALRNVPGEPVMAAFDLGPGWLIDPVLERLDAAGATVALVDGDGSPAPKIAVGPFTYVRLRRTVYTVADIDIWSCRLAEAAAAGRPVYAFFRHDDRGDAPRWATRLQAGLEH